MLAPSIKPTSVGRSHLRRSELILVVVIAILLFLVWWNRAQPADAQVMFYGPMVDGGSIEPPPLLGPQPDETRAPILPSDPPSKYASYYDPPAPDIVLEAPPDLELPDPPTVVVEQLPPIVMTRTCTRDNYYKGGKRYYHGRTHCTEPVPVPEPEQPPQ